MYAYIESFFFKTFVYTPLPGSLPSRIKDAPCGQVCSLNPYGKEFVANSPFPSPWCEFPHCLKYSQVGKKCSFCFHLQSGGKRSCRRNRSLMYGRTSSFSSTSFSKNGTSFRSSLSFLSTNQLSMGIPLESW